MAALFSRKDKSKDIQVIHGQSDLRVSRTFAWQRAFARDQWIGIILPVMIIAGLTTAVLAFAAPDGGLPCNAIPQHPDGTLIRAAGDGTVYYMENGQKRGVTSADGFNSFVTDPTNFAYGWNWNNIKVSNCADGNAPTGPPILFRGGTIVRVDGTAPVYMIWDLGGGNYQKRGITSEAALDALHYIAAYEQIIPAANAAEINQIPVGPDLDGSVHPDGVPIVNNGIIYLRKDGGRYGVSTADILASWGFGTGQAVAATAGDMALPDLGFLPYHEGWLLQGSTNSIYITDNIGGNTVVKRGFTDATVYTDLGFSFGEQHHVSDAELPPTGSQITEDDTPPDIYMDTPTANQTISGSYLMQGWAIDGIQKAETGVSRVDVYVDGTAQSNFFDQATYGNARSDVCTPTAGSYPGRPDCPNVGWQYTLDTTRLAEGTHTLTVKATDKDPTPNVGSVTVTVTVHNAPPDATTVPTPPPTPPPSTSPSSPGTGINAAPYGYLDVLVPGDPTATNPVLANGALISGWALDNNLAVDGSIKSVNMFLVGKAASIGSATRGFERDDVCTVPKAPYPGRTGCPNVGWQYTLNTTNLADGTYSIYASITDNDSPINHVYQTNSRAFTVRTTSPEAPQNPVCPTGQTGKPPNCKTSAGGITSNPATSTPPEGYINDPRGKQIIHPTIGPSYIIDGWALDNNETSIKSVRVYIDNKPVGYAAIHQPTFATACAANEYPNAPDCPTVGWSFPLSKVKLLDGTHWVSVVITDSDSPTPKKTTLDPQYFEIRTTSDSVPSGATLPNVGLDPVKPAGPISKTYTFSGWAVDNLTTSIATIKQVTVDIDYSPVGVVATNIARPDICTAKVVNSSCPYIGFKLPIDTTKYSDGNHIITMYAQASDSALSVNSASMSVNFLNHKVVADPGDVTAPGARAKTDQTDDSPAGTYQLHVVYMVPQGVDRHFDTDGTIARSVNEINGQLKKQAGVQMNLDTNQGQLDITYVQLPQPASYYRNLGGAIFDKVQAAMPAGLKDGSTRRLKNYLIYVDAGADNYLCGQSAIDLANYPAGVDTSGNDAMVFLTGTQHTTTSDSGGAEHYDCASSQIGTSGLMDWMMLHEMLHTLDLVPSCAPHTARSGATQWHVSDFASDVMYEVPGGEIKTGTPAYPTIDYHNDDYSNSPGSCRNLQHSLYVH